MSTVIGHRAEPSDRYQPIGNVTIIEAPPAGIQSEATWRFRSDDGAMVEVTFLAADLLRVRYLAVGTQPAISWATLPREWPAVSHRVDEGDQDRLAITTDAMRVEIGRAPFRLACSWPDGVRFAEDDVRLGMGATARPGPDAVPDPLRQRDVVKCFKRLVADEHIFGGGERTSALDRRGQRLVLYNEDPAQPHGVDTSQMYASIPFMFIVRHGRAYGVLVDSAARVDLDLGRTRPDVLEFGTAHGPLTYYVCAGPSPAMVLKRYSDITGHTPLYPRWALGYGQSRWSYFPEAYLRDVAHQLREHRIPCDSLWLDIDYMDGYRVFTWNPWRFSNPKQLVQDLAREGFRVVNIIDPGVKADETDETYRDGIARDAFLRRPGGQLFTGVVWSGESVFPDFSRADVREWWGERHRALLDAGVAGIWDDMNEPSLTNFLLSAEQMPNGNTLPGDVVHRPDGPDGPAVPHADFHNAFGMQMARATYEGLLRQRPDQRPFVLSRSGFAGIQRYAALWTGDNSADWEHIRLAMRMCLGLALSGVPFCGFDTGGFWGDATGELLVRFTQLGALFPFFRNHSALHTHPQEPWAFGQPYEDFCRQAIELRYRLMPYYYTLLEHTSRDAVPIIRPLIFAYPEYASYAAIEDELLVGDDLFAAPIYRPGSHVRSVEFPPGVWREWYTGERMLGPSRMNVRTEIDILPLFVREGAILPMGPAMQFTGQRPPDPLTLAIHIGPTDGDTATGELYEDDGETLAYRRGAWRRTQFHATRTSTDHLELRAESQTGGSYAVEPRDWLVELHLPYRDPYTARPTVQSAALRDKPESASWSVIERRYETIIQVPLGRVAAPFTLDVTTS